MGVGCGLSVINLMSPAMLRCYYFSINSFQSLIIFSFHIVLMQFKKNEENLNKSGLVSVS